ncbi:uncharacterized protein [Parasteatoda tepidariorum]|uniref:uncharacterized protein n=1 Tax=Parasteatoda tepidariorum TaxID=114398 RepID=UPI00077FB706|nr:uncharacterized protein LOC107451676 [Parasteatoda tepidariorum]
MNAEFQFLGHQRGWILFHIQKFIHSHRRQLLRPCDLSEIYALYSSLRSTYHHPIYNRYSLYWVLGYIIEQTYKSKIEDSDFVLLLLHSLLENDGHIGFLFTLSEDLTSSFQSSTILGYYLEHANRKAVLLGDVRIPCAKVFDDYHWIYPLEFAIQLKSPVILHELLRYGAIWSHESYRSCLRSKNLNPNMYIRDICRDLLRQIVHSFSLHNPELDHLYNLNIHERSSCEKLISCGTLILRDSGLYSSKMFRRKKIGETYLANSQMVSTLLAKLGTVAWPSFSDRFNQPMTLKHTSKLTIRRILNGNWHLPQGIYHLSLPRCLEKYLDLVED